MSANVRHSSESAEWGTPKDVSLMFREVMGGIDLDPASCARFNRHVQADHFYTKEENGYGRPWHGRVFLNPPGGYNDKFGHEVHRKTKTRESCEVTGSCGIPPGHKHEDVGSSAKRWWFRLATEWQSGRVTSAGFVCFDLGLLQTTQNGQPDGELFTVHGKPVDLYIPLKFSICYPSKRLDYIDEDGNEAGSPPHASCLVLLPGRPELNAKFARVFSRLGEVVVR